MPNDNNGFSMRSGLCGLQINAQSKSLPFSRELSEPHRSTKKNQCSLFKYKKLTQWKDAYVMHQL